jgi:hypothetical protein
VSHIIGLFINDMFFSSKADEQAKKVVRIVAIVLCVLAMVALIATIRMARKLEYVFVSFILTPPAKIA